jgi:hypothetical protein
MNATPNIKLLLGRFSSLEMSLLLNEKRVAWQELPYRFFSAT